MVTDEKLKKKTEQTVLTITKCFLKTDKIGLNIEHSTKF